MLLFQAVDMLLHSNGEVFIIGKGHIEVFTTNYKIYIKIKQKFFIKIFFTKEPVAEQYLLYLNEIMF